MKSPFVAPPASPFQLATVPGLRLLTLHNNPSDCSILHTTVKDALDIRRRPLSSFSSKVLALFAVSLFVRWSASLATLPCHQAFHNHHPRLTTSTTLRSLLASKKAALAFDFEQIPLNPTLDRSHGPGFTRHHWRRPKCPSDILELGQLYGKSILQVSSKPVL